MPDCEWSLTIRREEKSTIVQSIGNASAVDGCRIDAKARLSSVKESQVIYAGNPWVGGIVRQSGVVGDDACRLDGRGPTS